MTSPKDRDPSRWLPVPPWEGPPVPRGLFNRASGLPEPSAPTPQEPPVAVTPEDLPATPSPLEEYGLVMRPRSRPPIWLKQYQDRIGAVTRQAAAETVHLKGAERVMAMNALVSKLMREARGKE